MGTHPIFESDFDCLTEFGCGYDGFACAWSVDKCSNSWNINGSGSNRNILFGCLARIFRRLVCYSCRFNGSHLFGFIYLSSLERRSQFWFREKINSKERLNDSSTIMTHKYDSSMTHIYYSSSAYFSILP